MVRFRPLPALVAGLVTMLLLGAGQASARGLDRGFADPRFAQSDGENWLERAERAGASDTKVFISWRTVARSKPSNPRDPADPAYDFSSVDLSVQRSAARGLNLILGVYNTPAWAEGSNRDPNAPVGSWKPDPDSVGDFMFALAKRYSGSFGGLPRVRDYQLWNEQNLNIYLTPQYQGKKSFAVPHYKRMLDTSWDAVKAVSGSNRLITGGLAPYGDDPGGPRTRPLTFWREAFCLKNRKKLKRAKNCPGPEARFDVLAHNAINTSGAPDQKALNRDDASSGNLPDVVKILRAAEKRKTINRGRHDLWNTEFWYESNPPDPDQGVPLKRHADYIQLALYLSWKSGFTKAIHLRVGDDPSAASQTGGRTADGLYFGDGRAKPAAKAFRFPLVAERKSRGKTMIWGISPGPKKVVIQKRKGKRWVKVTKLKAKRGSIYKGKVRSIGRKDKLRAKAGKEKSLKARVRR